MKRRKPLIAITPLARKTPMKRKAPRRKKPKPGFTEPVRGRCIAAFTGCGGIATDRHHRKGRASGDHTPANRADLCHHCHHTVIHGHPAWAYAHGWLVHRWDEPDNIPLLFGCEPGCSCDIASSENKLGEASTA
jgi:hypothetical protein